MRIWKIRWMTAKRRPSLMRPTQVELVLPATVAGDIETWVHHRWTPSLLTWGLSFEVMVLMMKAWTYKLKLAWGFSWATAVAGAKANMTAYISTGAAAVAVPFLTLWGGLISLALYYRFVDFLEGYTGSWTFKPQRCLMAYEERFWFGTVIRHPELGMWDVERVFPEMEPMRMEFRDVGGKQSLLDFWHFEQLWETIGEGWVFWYVFYMNQAKLDYVNVGWHTGRQVWRVLAMDVEDDPFGLDVGFEEELGRFANWRADWNKYFFLSGDPDYKLF